MVSPNSRYTCREFLHEVNWKVVSPDVQWESISNIYITTIVVLVSEPVRGRSRATELPCFSSNIKQPGILYRYNHYEHSTVVTLMAYI